MLRHQLARTVAAGGRLLVSNYVPAGDRSRHAPEVLRGLSFRVDGITSPAEHDCQTAAPTAWIQRH
jgi:hypothetical protein